MPTPVFVIVRPPNREPYALPLDRLTNHIRAARTLRTMGKLASHFARANAAMDRVEANTKAHVDKLVERTDGYLNRLDGHMQKRHEALDGQFSELAEFERDLEEFGKNDRGGDGETIEKPAPQNEAQKEAGTNGWTPPADRSFKH